MVPPLPVQVSVKVAEFDSAGEFSLPDGPLVPLQPPPEAVHDVAFVDVQLRLVVPFTGTLVGEAERSTVGAGGGGGVPATVTVTDRPVVPPAPVHDRSNVELALMTGDCSEPDVAL